MSAYRVGIDLTTEIIATRARYFRNLIVSVVALSLASFGAVAITRTFRPLAGLFLLAPACGFFFLLDGRVLHSWRSQLLDSWVKKAIDFQAFRKAITSVPSLPKDTLRCMLSTLPEAEDLIAEQGTSSSTRAAVAATVEDIYSSQSEILALKTAASVIVAVSACLAVASRSWLPLSGAYAFVLLPLLRRTLKHRRLQSLESKTTAAQANPDFSAAHYQELVGRIP